LESDSHPGFDATNSREGAERLAVGPWEVGIETCRTEGAFLICAVSLTNGGEDKEISIRTCEAGVMPGQLPYCSRVYYSGAVVDPLDLEDSDKPLVSRPGMYPPRFILLSGQTARFSLRAANPPASARQAQRIDLHFYAQGVGPASASFTNVPIVRTFGASVDAVVKPVAVAGMQFHVIECARQRGDVMCRFGVENRALEREIELVDAPQGRTPMAGSPRARDASGTAYPIGSFVFASPQATRKAISFGGISLTLPTRDAVQFSGLVADVPATVQVLASLELTPVIAGYQSAVVFENVPVN
jgi:hypothetical protein